eukprot:TRINITY_DN2645_c1_g3_i1.p1 TRINITY_DN2645_c1_g3~~TRINITY_DN2645_c1_g3_i1.p1  ORF type:complete len:622 (-),score=252.31 TRINITY_DN2645_c1_g3_i1:40-1905(-)
MTITMKKGEIQHHPLHCHRRHPDTINTINTTILTTTTTTTTTPPNNKRNAGELKMITTPNADSIPQESEEEYKRRVHEQLNRIKQEKSAKDIVEEQRRKRQERLRELQEAGVVTAVTKLTTSHSSMSLASSTAGEDQNMSSSSSSRGTNNDQDDDDDVDDESSAVVLLQKENDESPAKKTGGKSLLSAAQIKLHNQSMQLEQSKSHGSDKGDGMDQGGNQNTGNQSDSDSDSYDMFAEESSDDDEEDIDEMDGNGGDALNKGKQVLLPAAEENLTLTDNWDDDDGYYRARLGELFKDGRYKLISLIGRGVFSTVVRSMDVKTGKTVAIKVVRNNDVMFKAGKKEIELLDKLIKDDPSNKKHCIRLLDHFEQRNHLCLVFEEMAMDVRDLLHKFGKGVGLSINAVRIYTKQLLIALRQLKHLGIMHADLKLDNMVVNEEFNVIKICDFGSASSVEENDITPYLVSRFYRAPEIIIGMRYDCALDMWSLGCCIFELFTGKICFPGKTNNEMLRLFQETKGKFPKHMLKKGELSNDHFDGNYFLRHTQDTISGQKVNKRVLYTEKPNRSIFQRLVAASPQTKNNKDLAKKMKQLADLLERMFVLDPSKRITVKEALAHQFLEAE